MVEKSKIIDALKTVYDPELGMDVWSLGLIYEIKIIGSDVFIKMTLTTPMCPYGPMLMEMIEEGVKQIKGVKIVKLELTFEPLWQPSDELKTMMGM
ncbi:MAG: metal-sulfur cluster assembly factor [archaeon]